MQPQTFVLRSVDSSGGAAVARRPGRWTRFVSYFLLGALATLFFSSFTISTTGVSADRAYALDFLDPCGNPNEEDLPSIEAWPGQSSSFLGTNRTIAWSDGTGPGSGRTPITDPNQLTAYEWYGTAGMSKYFGGWDSLDGVDACMLVDKPGTILGTSLLDFTFYIGEVGLSVLSLALSTSVTTNFLVGDDDGIISNVIAGFQDSLYQNYLLPVVMFAAIWIGWQGLVKRRGTEAVQGTAWVILSAIAAAAFFIWPVEIARTADNAVGAVGTTVISAMAAPAGQDGMCSLPESAPEREIRTVQCSLWNTFIFQPWAASQFGPLATKSIDASGSPISFRPNASGTNGLPLYFLDTRTLNYEEVKTNSSRSNQQRTAQWEVFVEEMKDPANKAGWSTFAGKEGAGLSDGLVALAALLFGTVPLVFFSFTLILQQVTFILLMLVAPLFLLAGLMPGMGRRLMLGWLELTASTVIKRVVTYVVAGLLLTAIGIITAASGSGAFGNFVQIIMIAIAGIATVAFRRRILDQYGKVNLGGDQSFLSRQDTNEIAQRGKGTFTEPIRGAAEARAQGRSGLVGAATATVKNIRGEGQATTVRDATRAVREASGQPSKGKQYKFAATFEEKSRQLNQLTKLRRQQSDENTWMNRGQLTAQEWKEYSVANGNRAVPRPKNNAFAAELVEQGVPMRSQVDLKLNKEIDRLEAELEDLNAAGPKNVNKTVRAQNRAARQAPPRAETVDADAPASQAAEDIINESEASQQPNAPRRPQPSSERRPTNPYARAQVFKNRAANKKNGSDSGGD